MKNNHVIRLCICFLYCCLLVSTSSCGLIELPTGDDGHELTDWEKYLLKIQAQLVGTWDIQFMSVDEVYYGYDAINKFSKIFENEGYRIVFNSDNTMRYYRDGYPANRGYYEVTGNEIICYTENYYDMHISCDLDEIQTGHLEKSNYAYNDDRGSSSSVAAYGRITLQKISSEEEEKPQPIFINPDDLLGTWILTHESGNQLINKHISSWNQSYDLNNSYLSLTFNVNGIAVYSYRAEQINEEQWKWMYKDGILKFSMEEYPEITNTYTIIKITANEMVITEKRNLYISESTFTRGR